MTDIALTCHMGPSGLSKVAREYFRLFSSNGMRVVPMWLSEPEGAGVNPAVLSSMTSASTKMLNGPPLQFFVGLPERMKVVKNNRAIMGSVVVEGSALTQAQVAACRGMDVVAVPSRFCHKVCVGSGVPKKKLLYLTYPLDSATWNPSVSPTIERSDRFKFLWMNTWHERKGYDVLLRAWWSEFSASDPVELVIKSYREHTRLDGVDSMVEALAAKLGVNLGRTAPITFIDEVMGDDELPGFMKSHDALVSPHRSEGFGMNPWYAMALGVPVICTDYGGCTDFAKEDTAWLVRTAGISRPGDAELATFPHLAGTVWAEPDIDDLKAKMRECFADAGARAQRASNGAQFVASEFSDEAVFGAFEAECRSRGLWDGLEATRKATAAAAEVVGKYDREKSWERSVLAIFQGRKAIMVMFHVGCEVAISRIVLNLEKYKNRFDVYAVLDGVDVVLPEWIKVLRPPEGSRGIVRPTKYAVKKLAGEYDWLLRLTWDAELKDPLDWPMRRDCVYGSVRSQANADIPAHMAELGVPDAIVDHPYVDGYVMLAHSDFWTKFYATLPESVFHYKDDFVSSYHAALNGWLLVEAPLARHNHGEWRQNDVTISAPNKCLGDMVCTLSAAREYARSLPDLNVHVDFLDDVVALYGDGLVKSGVKGYTIRADTQQRHRVKVSSSDLNYVGSYLASLGLAPGSQLKPELPDVPPLPGLVPGTYIALQPYSRTVANPEEGFVQALVEECSKAGFKTVIVGAWDTKRDLSGVCYDHVCDSIPKMLSVVRHARAVLTPCSASAHLSAAYGKKTFLWTQDDGENWHYDYPGWPHVRTRVLAGTGTACARLNLFLATLGDTYPRGTLSAHMIIRDGVKYDYPFIESCMSVLPVCDELVVVDGYSDDGTFEKLMELRAKFPDKIKLFREKWAKGIERRDGKLVNNCDVLADMTNLAIEKCSCEYHFQIQADEALHEKYHARIRAAVEKGGFDCAVLGVIHFWSGFDKVYKPGVFYDDFVRLARREMYPDILSTIDACSLSKVGRVLDMYDVVMYHYGYVRKPAALIAKQKLMTGLFGMEELDSFLRDGERTGRIKWKDKRPVDELISFDGTHPSAMLQWAEARLAEVGWGGIQ